PDDAGRGHVIEVGLAERQAKEVRRHIVAPVVGYVAPDAREHAERRVPQVVDTRAAFDASSADVERSNVIRAGTAERRELLRRQERVRTPDLVGYEKCARSCDLG